MLKIGNNAAPNVKSALILTGIVLLGFVLRLIAAHLEPLISRDSVIYLELAENWAQGAPYPENTYLPGFPWLIKLLMHCGLDSYTAGLGLNLVLGSLLPLIFYGLIRLLVASPKVAFAGALLASCQPNLIELSTHILRDIPYLFCVGLALYFLIAAIKYQNWRQWIACSWFMAWGTVIRYETLELLPIIAGYFVVAGVKRCRPWKQLGRELGVCALSLILFLVGLLCVMGTAEQVFGSYAYRFKMIFVDRL